MIARMSAAVRRLRLRVDGWNERIEALTERIKRRNRW